MSFLAGLLIGALVAAIALEFNRAPLAPAPYPHTTARLAFWEALGDPAWSTGEPPLALPGPDDPSSGPEFKLAPQAPGIERIAAEALGAALEAPGAPVEMLARLSSNPIRPGDPDHPYPPDLALGAQDPRLARLQAALEARRTHTP